MLETQEEANEDMKLSNSVHLNLDIQPKLVAIQKHLQDHATSRHGELVIPSYTIGHAQTVSAILEYSYASLKQDIISPADLKEFSDRYESENYVRAGIHLHLPDEASQVISQIGIKIIGIVPSLQSAIFWRGDLSRKAVTSICIYYVYSTI